MSIIRKEEDYKSGFGDNWCEPHYIITEEYGEFRLLKTTFGAFSLDGEEQIGYGGQIELCSIDGINGGNREKINKLLTEINSLLNNESTISDEEMSYVSCVKHHITLTWNTERSPQDLDNAEQIILDYFENEEVK